LPEESLAAGIYFAEITSVITTFAGIISREPARSLLSQMVIECENYDSRTRG
jgi:hypothetical protein